MSSGPGGASRAERQLEVTQAITHIGSWNWDVRSNVVTWSDELYRIYGFEPRSREVTLEFFLSRLDERGRDRVQANVREALAHRARFAYPERIVRPDGTIRQLDTIGEVSLDEAGQVIGLIGTCRDVTEERARDDQIRLYAEIVENVQIGLSVWEVDEPPDIAHIRLVAYNPASEKTTRLSLADASGKSLLEIAPSARGSELERLLVGVARDGEVREATVPRSRDPKNPTRALAFKAFPLAGGRVGVAIEDVTDQRTARRLQAAEQRVFEMIASGAPLDDVLTTLVLAIEEHSPPTIASILLLDSTSTHIRRGAAPNLPGPYNDAIEGAPIGPRAGSCGTTAFLGRPVFVHDIETDPLWTDYRELARAHGLRACWSTPIVTTDGRVLGTFALYYREAREPGDSDRSLIARATHIAGIAIERQELEDQLRDLSAHVESVREDERTGIAREIHDQLGQG
jgi:PAS domain-containing protein